MCRSGGRRCPACDEPSTANRHNFVRRAKSQGLSVATLAAQSADAEVVQLSTDGDDVVKAAEQITQNAPKKSLRELLAEKQGAATSAVTAKERRRAAAATNTAWARHGFAGAGRPRSGLGGSGDRTGASELDHQMIQRSQQWASGLSAQQYESLSDYSLGASEALNARLLQRGPLGEGAQRLVSDLDAALESAGISEQPTIVYRGLSSPEGIMAEEWAEVDFPVGAEVQFPTYLSTTTDPAIAASFSNAGDDRRSIVLEIKTCQGAPMAAVSNYGNAEREHLMPRETSARVVGVHYDVPFVGADGSRTTKTVIQLVEISAWSD